MKNYAETQKALARATEMIEKDLKGVHDEAVTFDLRTALTRLREAKTHYAAAQRKRSRRG